MPAKWKMVMIQNKCHLTSCITIAHVKYNMCENKKNSCKINHIKKKVSAKCQKLKIFCSCLHVSHRGIHVFTGVMDHGQFWLQYNYKEVIVFCQVYNKPLLEPMLTYIKRNLSGSYNISVAIIIMSKFGCFHSFNNVGSWTTVSSLVAVSWLDVCLVPSHCKPELMLTYCELEL